MRTPGLFFSRKNLVFIVGCVVAIGLLTVIWVFGVRTVDYIKQSRAQKAQQAAYDRLSSAEKAIRKAEQYEADMITTAKPAQRLLFDYIQRTYQLNPRLGVASTPLSIPENPLTYPNELNYLARIAFPDKIVIVSPKTTLEGISFTNVYAANCDNLQLPNNFWIAMDEQYRSGGYYLTHVALAFRFLKDNSCTIPDEAKVLESQVNRGMIAIVNNSDTGADLRYEAITFLLLAGERSEVKKEWIDQIASEQLPNGGWAVKKENKVADDHATLLAMWALLQYSRPDVEYQPLIRH